MAGLDDVTSTETTESGLPPSTAAAPAKKKAAVPNQPGLNEMVANPEYAKERDAKVRDFYQKQLDSIDAKQNSFNERWGLNDLYAQFGGATGAVRAQMMGLRQKELEAQNEGKKEATAGIQSLDQMKQAVQTRQAFNEYLQGADYYAQMADKETDPQKKTLLQQSATNLTKKAQYLDPQAYAGHLQTGDIGKTNDMRNFAMAKSEGKLPPNMSFADYQLMLKKAGATNVNVSNSTAKSLAGQIGEMAKDSKEKTVAAEKIDDSANRIIGAIDSKKLIAGPFANQRLTAYQVADFFGIKGDTEQRLVETRNAMQGLAQLTLQGRQEMKGQGAITENESKLAERAISGDISLTPTELMVLANAAKRTAEYQRQQHNDLITTMGQDPETAKLVPYYKVRPKNSFESPKPSPTGNLNQPVTTPPPTENNFAEIAKKQNLPYDPIKFDYRINSQGQLESKPKAK